MMSYDIFHIFPCADLIAFNIQGRINNADIKMLQESLEINDFQVVFLESLSSLIARKNDILFTFSRNGEFTLSNIHDKNHGSEILSIITTRPEKGTQ